MFSIIVGTSKRAFSTLKIIKNRLRSSLNQERLEAFTMMSAVKLVLGEVKKFFIVFIKTVIMRLYSCRN